jgi:hypothetical protein
MKMELFKAGPKMLMRMTMPQMGTTDFGFDGDVGWTYNPISGPMLVEGEMIEQMRQQAKGKAEMFTDAKSLTLVGTREIDGRKTVHLRAQAPDSTLVSAYYDVESGLLTALGGAAVNLPATDSTALMMFSDYRRIDGELVPHLVTLRASGYAFTARTTLYDHQPIDSAVFLPPAPVRELLAKRAKSP